MLKTESMERITLLCRNTDKEKVISILAQAKAVHLTDHQKQELSGTTIDIGTPFASAEELSVALVATRNLRNKLPPFEIVLTSLSRKVSSNTTTFSVQIRAERVREIARAYGTHEQELALHQKELQLTQQQLALLELLRPLQDPVATLFQAHAVETIVAQQGKKTKKTVTSQGRGVNSDEIRDRFDPYFLHADNTAVVAVVRKKDADRVRDHLTSKEYTMVDFSPLKDVPVRTAHLIPIEAFIKLDSHRTLLQRVIARTQETMESFSQHASFLAESEPIFELELLKAQAPLRFGTTKRITLVQGFIPQRRVNDLQYQLTQGEIDVVLETKAVPRGLAAHRSGGASSDAPVALNNPHVIKDFESLIELYTLPKYDELDPTSLMAFTFPIFFGFMLGDIGYGMVALIATLIFRHYAPKARRFANIFILSTISSVIFGFVFGEFFGTESIFGFYHLTPLINRTEDLMLLAGIALVIGVVHINLGLVLGMINEAKDGVFYAIIKKGSWILLQFGALLLLASKGLLASVPILKDISIDSWTAWTVLGLAIAGIYYSERIKGIIELPMIVSNILSYTRLVALGLASVYLAFVMNSIAGGFFVKGGLWLVIGTIILLAGHALNLTLGLLGPFLHSLRLHYVEFFTKFYDGGGKPYRPFGVIEART